MYASDGLRGKVGCLGKPLVPKMPGTRKDHRDAMLIAGLDALIVALGATGLDDAGHTVRGEHVNIVAEREERVACTGKAALLHALALAEVLGTLAGSSAESTRLG